LHVFAKLSEDRLEWRLETASSRANVIDKRIRRGSSAMSEYANPTAMVGSPGFPRMT